MFNVIASKEWVICYGAIDREDTICLFLLVGLDTLRGQGSCLSDSLALTPGTMPST